MSEVETFHNSQAERDSEEEEVIFREDNPRVENSTPPSMITSHDLDIVIEDWEQKFRKGQYQYEQYSEGRLHATGDTWAPHRGDARGT